MTAAAFADVDPAERDDWIPEFLEVYRRELGRHGGLFDGVATMLERLEAAGTPWGIVTNKPEGLAAALMPLLGWEQRAALDRLAPTHLAVPSGFRIPVDYRDPTQPALAVRLQEMFGQTETPRVGGGKVPVTLHLLSPAGRPVQVTRDLAGFWPTTYFDVRKDLRGRYPRHHWPDDPLVAEPTRRVRRPK